MTLDVTKIFLFICKSVNDVQFANIFSILMTFIVLKLFKFNFVIELQF